MSTSKIRLFEQIKDVYIGTQAQIEALTGVIQGAVAYATNRSAYEHFGTYNGSAWEWDTAGGGGALLAANNLADVASATTSRANLGLSYETIMDLIAVMLLNGVHSGIIVNYDDAGDAFDIQIDSSELATTIDDALNGNYIPNTGWTPLVGGYTITRSASDDPTYTMQIAGFDVTGRFSEGSPIKWTQNSIVRYGWVSSAPVYSGGNTTWTVLTRCNDASANYDVLDTGTHAISLFYYAPPKQPGVGFPVDVDYWTYSTSNTANAHKTPPTTSVWYGGSGLTNTGPSVDAPIGSWHGTAKGILESEDTTTTDFNCYGTVSTANNSESDNKNTFFIALTTPSGTYKIWGSINIPFYIHPTTKTTYYMNIMTTAAADAIHIRGDVKPSRFDLVCAYL